MDEGRATVIVNSVTELDRTTRGRVVVCGSHGGVFAAQLAVKAAVAGIVLSDAAVGKDRAGIAGLAQLDDHGIPAATTAHTSAGIGDGQDAYDHGLLSHVNDAALELGCARGMRVREAAELMAAAPSSAASRQAPPLDAEITDGRHLLRAERPRVWALDSASAVLPSDAGDILMTGSHGELLGGDRATALRVEALAAVFNDAGRPVRDVPAGRLVTLDTRGIAAATVDTYTARIGDGQSTYFDGILSSVNETARALGVEPGMTARRFTDLVLADALSRTEHN